ncbi:MAG TPA: hypothetical protein VFU16_04130 [Solirubrobacterales bacterium]|nr:hypothetical protein [Solirubrobacterales bacterium]
MSGVQVVGVHPGAELRRRQSLFAALAEAFPGVRFEGREAGERAGLAALIELGGEGEARSAAGAGLRALAALAPERDPGPAAAVELAAGTSLDRRLHGQALPDRHLDGIPAPAPGEGAEVLARRAGAPVWVREGRLDLVAAVAAELCPGEPLRDRLGRERSLALLPLVELLRELTDEQAWSPPPLRAAFLLDDPNLHWPSYGFLSLPGLRRHAEEHGYHLALAMVPLDARVAHPGAARLLREGSAISLCVHGNDHFGGELGRAREEGEALALAAQARRRIAAFERRTGVPVSPLMVPPHEECSEAMAAALARTGFAAISMTRPFPWLSPPPLHWLSAGEESGALSGWEPADVAAGGMPVLLRHPFADAHFSPAELALRAYLDQPLVLYGHHDDLAEGLDILAERSAAVNRLGPVRWGSLGAIAAANLRWRLEGDLLRLRPYSRRVTVEVPAGARHVVVEPPWDAGGEVVEGPSGAVPVGEPFEVHTTGQLNLSLRRSDAVDPEAVPPPRRRPAAIARRLAGETRDRLAPARRRLRAGPLQPPRGR